MKYPRHYPILGDRLLFGMAVMNIIREKPLNY